LPSHKSSKDIEQSSSGLVVALFENDFAERYAAAQLGLLEEDAPGSSLTTMLQGLTRFLAEKITLDWRSIPPHMPMIEQVRRLSLHFQFNRLTVGRLLTLMRRLQSDV
jgi:hypothetical protein